METINAAYIRNLRARLELSQDEFAKEVGTVSRSITRWENGESRPREKAMIRKIRDLARSLEQEVTAQRADNEIESLRKENQELKAKLKKLAKKENRRSA